MWANDVFRQQDVVDVVRLVGLLGGGVVNGPVTIHDKLRQSIDGQLPNSTQEVIRDDLISRTLYRRGNNDKV